MRKGDIMKPEDLMDGIGKVEDDLLKRSEGNIGER